MTDKLAGVFNEFARHLHHNSVAETRHDLQIRLFADACVNWRNETKIRKAVNASEYSYQ